jgi:leader peptidase (prepilin peptidase)/N-methyltransferase
MSPNARVVFLLVGVGLLGTCLGSFLNVVVYRLPRECMSLARPRSRCPRCARPIRWFENVPVLSWVLLGGRCRGCHGAISLRYPLVELGTGVLFVLMALMLLPRAALLDPPAHAQAWVTLGAAALVTSALIALALVDLDWLILPDPITKSGIILGPLLASAAPDLQPSLVTQAWFDLSPRLGALVHGVLGALAASGALWFVGYLGARAFRKPAMGLGDVKMAAAMGGLLGLWAFLAIGVAAIAGALVGLVMVLFRGRRYLPFGPFLAFGTWAVMLQGREILAWWLGVFEPLRSW